VAAEEKAGLGAFSAALSSAVASLMPSLKPFTAPTEIGAEVAQLLGAENQQHDDQNDQPMPDAERTHVRFSI
jgi:hypothetical protein